MFEEKLNQLITEQDFGKAALIRQIKRAVESERIKVDERGKLVEESFVVLLTSST